jgi:thioredoxin 1
MSKHVMEATDQTFQERVLQSNKPVLVDFGAAWCPPCRMMIPTVEALAEKYAGVVNFFEVNVDENPSTMQRYGIKGIPALILFKNGKEEERIVGAASKETLSRMIDKCVVPENA